MRSVTASYRNALRGQHKSITLAKFKFGSTTYYLSNSDTPINFEGDNYSPSYLVEVGSIELTSQPKVNEIDVAIDATDGIFAGLILSQQWMNNKLTLTRLVYDQSGVLAGSQILFVGLIGDYELSTQGDRHLTLRVASFFKDFQKQAGIRSNTESQQRFYPGDTALDHCAKATKDTYWGKDKPTDSNVSSVGNTSPIFTPPTMEN